MTPAQAENLAVRLSQRWRNLGPLDELAADLIDLDAQWAEDVYERMRKTRTQPLTVPDFRSEVRAWEASRQQPRTTTPSFRAAPIGLSDYLAKLMHRSTLGDQEAEAELRHWSRALGEDVTSQTWTGRTR